MNTTHNNMHKIIEEIEKNGTNINSPFSIMPWVIIIIGCYIIIYYLIKIEVNSSDNWNKDKCSSKYIFFSGFMEKKGNPFKKTLKNFIECINPKYNNLIL